MRVVALAIGLLVATGCRNSCQEICQEMADYAGECGIDVSSDEIKQCRSDHIGKLSREDYAVCRDFNDAETLRQEWSCADVAIHWSGDGSENSESPTDSGL